MILFPIRNSRHLRVNYLNLTKCALKGRNPGYVCRKIRLRPLWQSKCFVVMLYRVGITAPTRVGCKSNKEHDHVLTRDSMVVQAKPITDRHENTGMKVTTLMAERASELNDLLRCHHRNKGVHIPVDDISQAEIRGGQREPNTSFQNCWTAQFLLKRREIRLPDFVCLHLYQPVILTRMKWCFQTPVSSFCR